jgi:hypothetical protein
MVGARNPAGWRRSMAQTQTHGDEKISVSIFLARFAAGYRVLRESI